MFIIIIIIIVVIIIVFLLGAARPTPRTAGAGCDFFLVKGDIVAKSLQDLLLPVSGLLSSLGLCWFVWVCFRLFCLCDLFLVERELVANIFN